MLLDNVSVLSGAGFLLLAASLVLKKKAGWAVLVGATVLAVLASRESDPTLALGALALAAARCVRTPPKNSPAPGASGRSETLAPSAPARKPS